MAFFRFEDKNVYYSEMGEGTPLLMLHGNTASSNMFAEVAGAYAGNYKVILIDFLGHGQSDRLERFPADLWFYEARQVIAFLREKQYTKVHVIGSSGGALVAVNVALEAPELVDKVIADSFEGEKTLKAFTENVVEDREKSKEDEGARMFYRYMHGDDWEQVVDNDTRAIAEHDREIGIFFHRPLQELKADILMTGSKMDEFITAVSPDYFEQVYGEMLNKIGHGEMHLFETGGHPAILSNPDGFYEVSMSFLGRASVGKQFSNPL